MNPANIHETYDLVVENKRLKADRDRLAAEIRKAHFVMAQMEVAAAATRVELRLVRTAAIERVAALREDTERLAKALAEAISRVGCPVDDPNGLVLARLRSALAAHEEEVKP